MVEIETRQLTAICAAVHPLPSGEGVVCTGIATFSKNGELSREITGGKLEWKVSMDEPDKIKDLIRKCVQGNLQTTAGVVYQVSRDKIFIMSKAAYKTTIKKAELHSE